MKVKINQIIYGIDGKTPIQEGEPKEPLTLKNVCITSVLTSEKEEDESKKYLRWELCKKLRDCEDIVDLKIEEISLIKKSIGACYVPLVMGQAFDYLEKT